MRGPSVSAGVHAVGHVWACKLYVYSNGLLVVSAKAAGKPIIVHLSLFTIQEINWFYVLSYHTILCLPMLDHSAWGTWLLPFPVGSAPALASVRPLPRLQKHAVPVET